MSGLRSGQYHWRGRPDRCDPALLERSWVGDEALLRRLQERFVDGLGGARRHFQVLVGPAGVGKSHAAALLVARIQEDAGARAVVRRLPTHLVLGGDLEAALLWLLRSLGIDPEPDASVDDLLPALDAALEHPLLLVVEDLGHWLAGLREAGQRQLRALLQEGGKVQILATAAVVPEALRDQGQPFFGFFNVAHLAPLELPQVIDLLVRLGQDEGVSGLSRDLRSKARRPDLQALFHILGGRAGRYVGLLRDTSDLDQPGRMLLRAIENRERKFRHQCQLLSRQQALILAWLAEQNRAYAVKDCARALGLAEQSASPQLRALRRAGHVSATVIGRETWYEVEDPLCGLDPDWALAWFEELRQLHAGVPLGEVEGDGAAALRALGPDPDARELLRLPLLLRSWLAAQPAGAVPT